MPDTHYEMLEFSSPRAKRIMDHVRAMQVAMSGLQTELDVMTQMKSGDGSSAAHFADVAIHYAVDGSDTADKNASAKVIYDELNSALGNSAALKQFLNKVG